MRTAAAARRCANIKRMQQKSAANTSRGAPDRYGVVGHPIAHSRSPMIHGLFAASTGEHMIYDRYDILPENFDREVRAFFVEGGRGLNVTVPHKEIAMRFADELSPRAKLAGAVNTLIKLPDGRIRGDNTDGAGLMTDLQRIGCSITGKRVIILGAGGATRGILGPLREAHPALLIVANRSAERARELAGEAGCGYADLAPGVRSDTAEPFDVVIHATSLGLEGKAPEVATRIIGANSVAYDLGYGNPDTPFVRWARHHGAAQAAHGLGMLVEQAAESFFLWRGVRPETGPVHTALRG